MDSSGDDDGNTASRKPKRPLTAYNIFFKDKRQEILQRGSSGGFAALARNIAAMWKLVSPDTKAHYLNRAAEDKQRYQREMAQWQGMAVASSRTKKSSPDSKNTKKRAMIAPPPASAGAAAPADRSPSIEQGNDAWGLHRLGKEGRSSFDSDGSPPLYSNQEAWMSHSAGLNSNLTGIQRRQRHHQQQQRLEEAQRLRREEAGTILDRRLLESSRRYTMRSEDGMDTSLDLLLHQQQIRQRREEEMMARAMRNQYDGRVGVGNERSTATAEAQQLQPYLPMALPVQQHDSLFQRPIARAQQHQLDQVSTTFTPNSLRRVFESDVDSVAALPPAEDEKIDESQRLSFDEETMNLMDRMMEQESDAKRSAHGEKDRPRGDR